MIGDYGLNDELPKKKRFCCSPIKDKDRRVVYNGYPLYLPKEDILDEFKAAYPDTTNAELMAITGRGSSYNSRLGNYLGLSKSQAFIDRRMRNCTEATKRNHSKGKPKKGLCPEWLKRTQFGQPNGNKPAVWTPEKRKEQGKKIRTMFARERLRVAYGLPRLTRLKIGNYTKSQYQQRYCMRKYGYIEVGEFEYVYTATTHRSVHYESLHTYKFYSEEEWKHLNKAKDEVTAIRTWEDKQGGFCSL